MAKNINSSSPFIGLDRFSFPSDILEVNAAYSKDPNPQKLNLIMGSTSIFGFNFYIHFLTDIYSLQN